MERYKVLFFTGAGISAESGISTFEEMDGDFDIRSKLERTYAIRKTEDYKKAIIKMRTMCYSAEPNLAHKAIATLDYPVITMNIDELHQKAGSNHVLAIHGRFPTDEEIESENFKYLLNIPVLYSDPAPNYQQAFKMVRNLEYNNSYFIVIGTSFYTKISQDLLDIAKQRKANIFIINENATVEVPKLIEKIKNGMMEKLLL